MPTPPDGPPHSRAKSGSRGKRPASEKTKPSRDRRDGGPGQLASDHPLASQARLVSADLPGSTAESMAAELLGGWACLGGTETLRRADLHKILVQGLPTTTLARLLGEMKSLRLDELAVAVGVSDRTLRRYLEEPEGTLVVDVGSRLWSFALLLAKAVAAMGSRADAERWLIEPAWGLDDERPLDLMQTEPGRALVDEFLERLLHGVYN